jgi:hypothetical protein
VLRDSREHAGADFVGIMEWIDVVREARATQHAMRSALAFDGLTDPKQRL